MAELLVKTEASRRALLEMFNGGATMEESGDGTEADQPYGSDLEHVLRPQSRSSYTHIFMLKEILEQGQRTIDQALEKLLPAPTQRPESIHQAMRHSVFAGGKRLRQGVEELGSALEMLHTYSLIHDDLPALDNDDLRRGKPTCHVVYGEAIAILAGDALQTQAYEVLSRMKCPAEARVRIIEEIARGTGTVDGMIGGQVKDLEAERQRPDAATLEYIHRSKTGALITASLVSGGIYAGGSTTEIQRLRDFGRAVGLAFHSPSRLWMTYST